MDEHSDSSLIELAKGGDQHAFAELYSRYFDPVYDFVARMTRNRDEAADIAQDTFLKAMNALGGLQKGASFKSWIFTIARNTALNRIEKNARTRPLTFEGEDGEEVGFDVVDTDRFSDPEEAAEANAVASLVWQAAAGLDPRQLSLLDLHLRQGLDSGEIADVLGVTKNNGYVMLNRLKKAVEDAIGAFIMFKDGRQYCSELDGVLQKVDIDGMSPEVRKLVERHVAKCASCEERKKKLAPLAAFAAFGAVGAPMGAKAHILEGLLQQWPGAASTAAGGGAMGQQAGGVTGGGSGGGSAAAMAFLQRFPKIAAAGIGTIAAALLLLLAVPASPLALTRGENDEPTVQADAGGDPPGPSPSTAFNQLSPTATKGASATPSGTAEAGVGSATATSTSGAATGTATNTATPTRTNTPVPTPGPGTPTFTPSATATRTSTATPTATATACVPSLGASPDSLTIPLDGSSSFLVTNGTGCPVTFSVSSSAPWISLSGGGTVPASGSMTVGVSVNGGKVPTQAGTYGGIVVVAWSGGAIPVSVSTTRTGVPPVITSATGSCNVNSGATTFSASVSDDGTVVSVVVDFVDGDGVPRHVAMVNAGANAWRASNGPNGIGVGNFVFTATDDSGLTATFSLGMPRTCAP